MNIKKLMLLLLIIAAGTMIYLGIKANIKPPILTGIGFIIIAYLFYSKK